jgi:class 3 adenylate cyclase
MSLKDDLASEVQEIFARPWQTRKGTVVPDPDDLALGNDAVTLDGTILYADLSESTALVDTYNAPFAAEVYKCYLLCAGKIVTSQDGVITAYDGDRIMAVYIGDSKNTNAARSALHINYAVDKIINPALVKQYPNTPFRVKHAVGVDTSSLFVARTGFRGANDLVWVGRAANHAAKLSAITNPFVAWITADVHSSMNESARTSNGTAMWTQRIWTAMNNRVIYGSNWTWPI